MPTNLYGPNDNYDFRILMCSCIYQEVQRSEESNKPEVEIWGTGSPMREFLHVDDLADASLFLMRNYDGQEHVNVGTGTDITIKDLALLVRKSSDTMAH